MKGPRAKERCTEGQPKELGQSLGHAEGTTAQNRSRGLQNRHGVQEVLVAGGTRSPKLQLSGLYQHGWKVLESKSCSHH